MGSATRGPRARYAERGMALGIVILTSIVFTTAAFAVLSLSLSRTADAQFKEQRLRARYAAEAGLVRAMGRFWRQDVVGDAVEYPPGCAAGSPSGAEEWAWDFDGDGTVEPNEKVTITVTNCGANREHTLAAKVTYP